MRFLFIFGIAVILLIFQAACAPRVPAPIPTPTTALPTPSPTRPALIQAASAWIEVDLAKQVVLLHKGDAVIAELPASTGVASDPKYATPPGLYRVQSRDKGPVESAPGVFVSDVVMFDLRLGNGFHSRPTDAQGKLLDETLGTPATAGCVRVGESARLFDFAQLGMWVWIH